MSKEESKEINNEELKENNNEESSENSNDKSKENSNEVSKDISEQEKAHDLLHKKIKEKENSSDNPLGDAPKEMINAIVGLTSTGVGGAIKIGKDVAEKSLKTAIKIGDTAINGTIDTLVGVDDRSIEEITRETRRKLEKSSQIMKILSEDPNFQKNINSVGNLYKQTLTGSKDDINEITELYKTIVKDVSEALAEAIVDSIDVGFNSAVSSVPGMSGVVGLTDAGKTWFDFAGTAIKSSTENGFKIWNIANKIGDRNIESGEKIVEDSNKALIKYDEVSDRVSKSMEESNPKNTVNQKGGKKTRKNRRFKKTRKFN